MGVLEGKLINPKSFFLRQVVSSLKSQKLRTWNTCSKGNPSMAPSQWNWFSMEGFNTCKSYVVHCIFVQNMFCSLHPNLRKITLISSCFYSQEAGQESFSAPKENQFPKVCICSQWGRWKRKDLPRMEPRAMENIGLGIYCRGRTRTCSRNIF